MDEKQRAHEVRLAIESVRNLRPRVFGLMTDPDADIKARWDAFDEFFEAVREVLQERGHPQNLLRPLVENPAASAAQVDRSGRVGVAMIALAMAYGPLEQSMNVVMMQAEALVPTPPDPDTGAPLMTLKDQALLSDLTNFARMEMTEDWECFYKGDSEPAAKRKLAFRRMYAVIGKTWMEESLFPRSMKPEDRQKLLIFAFMCHVPKDQWGEEDIKKLHADLLPIEEPDWEDQALFGP